MDETELDDFDDDQSIEHTYLTFSVADEDYALHVGHVIEIVRLQRIFAVPDVDDHICGVINLRGKIIPLLDVRRRFGLPEQPYTDRTVVVVVEVEGAPTGLVVDGVFDITEIPPASIEAAPLARGGPSLVRALGKRGDRVSFVLDVPTLVATTKTTQVPLAVASA